MSTSQVFHTRHPQQHPHTVQNVTGSTVVLNNDHRINSSNESTKLHTIKKINDKQLSSKTIWTGTILTSVDKSSSFTATFDKTEADQTIPNGLLQGNMTIVGRTGVAKLDKFTKNKGHRTMLIYGLNIIKNKEIYEELLPQYIQKESVGVITTQTGHVYIVPRVLKNKIQVLKNKTFSTIAIVIMIVKSVKKDKAIVKENVDINNLFSSLAYYRGQGFQVPSSQPPPQQQQHYQPSPQQYGLTPPQQFPQYQSQAIHQYQPPPQQYMNQYGLAPPQQYQVHQYGLASPYPSTPVLGHKYTPSTPQPYIAPVPQLHIPQEPQQYTSW